MKTKLLYGLCVGHFVRANPVFRPAGFRPRSSKFVGTPLRTMPELLSPEQQTAVDGAGPYALVRASPGAGKTTTLCARVQRVLAGGGGPPDGLVILTYTVASRRDLQKRLVAMLSPGVASKIKVRTVHGLAYHILTQAGAYDAARCRILNAAAVKQLLANAGAAVQREDGTRRALSDLELKSMLQIKELSKAGAPCSLTPFAEGVLQGYERIKPAEEFDFADLVLRATEVLRRPGLVASLFSPASCHLFIDEAQDLTRAQIGLLRTLTACGRWTVFAVADPAQTIYTWRGSTPDLDTALANMVHPHALQSLRLHRTFRCPPHIFLAANSVLATVTPDIARERVERLVPASGRVVHMQRTGVDAAAIEVAHYVRSLQRAGVALHDVVVLCRLRAHVAVASAIFSNAFMMPTNVGAHELPAARRLISNARLPAPCPGRRCSGLGRDPDRRGARRGVPEARP